MQDNPIVLSRCSVGVGDQTLVSVKVTHKTLVISGSKMNRFSFRREEEAGKEGLIIQDRTSGDDDDDGE